MNKLIEKNLDKHFHINYFLWKYYLIDMKYSNYNKWREKKIKGRFVRMELLFLKY